MNASPAAKARRAASAPARATWRVFSSHRFECVADDARARAPEDRPTVRRVKTGLTTKSGRPRRTRRYARASRESSPVPAERARVARVRSRRATPASFRARSRRASRGPPRPHAARTPVNQQRDVASRNAAMTNPRSTVGSPFIDDRRFRFHRSAAVRRRTFSALRFSFLFRRSFFSFLRDSSRPR